MNAAYDNQTDANGVGSGGLKVFKEFTTLCDSSGNEKQPDDATHIQFIVSGSAGNGGLRRGCPNLPSIDSSKADSSPQM